MIFVEKREGLGLIVPPPTFGVADLETHVGSMRELDVIDVDRQLGIKMLMRRVFCDVTGVTDEFNHSFILSFLNHILFLNVEIVREWAEYYSSPEKSKIFNLISLEVSNTSLASLVVAPEIVRKIDLINQIWPKESPFSRFQLFCK